MAPGEAVLCIRPEAMRTGDGALSFGPGKVAASAFFGTHTRVQVVPEAAPDLVLTAHLPPSEMPEAGNRLTLSADASAFSLFPAGD
nr:TOBE domain-containing protein [Roseobacter ponti]